MEIYDPNEATSLNFRHRLRLTFQAWRYKLTCEATVGGNCGGFKNLDSAISQIYDTLPVDRFGSPTITLKHGDSELICSDEDDKCEDWLKSMLVSAEIIALEAAP